MTDIRARAREFLVWRELKKRPLPTIREIAAELHMNKATVRDIVERKGWKAGRGFDGDAFQESHTGLHRLAVDIAMRESTAPTIRGHA